MHLLECINSGFKKNSLWRNPPLQGGAWLPAQCSAVRKKQQGIMPLNGMIVIINANKKHQATYDGKTDRIMIGVNFYSI